ncbi:hypothetical protein AMD27_02175 [Acinetobacter sp. TGL-Y2]|nr:hypothetical protein AMD27_02175 [Acinetobacter sp. TGL-Y2]
MISAVNLSALNAIPYMLGLVVLILILLLSLWLGKNKSENEFDKKGELCESIFIITIWCGIVFCIIKVILILG